MTFDEFVNKYNGKATDYDGGCGVQCVDLAKLYMDKVCNVKIGAIGNAEAYFRRYDELSVLKNNFTKIKNTAKFIPQKGDIAVWGTKLSQYGHIAICDGEGTTSYFYSYDQNWGGKEMKRIKHTYKGFEGVLRPKAKQIATLKAKTDNTPIRNAKDLSNPNNVVAMINKDTLVSLMKTEGEWGIIPQGYIHLDNFDYMTIKHVIVKVNNAPLRKSGNHQGDVIAFLGTGTPLDIVEINENNFGRAIQGWVNLADC